MQYFIAILMFLGLLQNASAQPLNKKYYIKDGKIHVSLSKNIDVASLQTFTKQFNLNELSLNKFINENFTDSILKKGWSIDENTSKFFIISKLLTGSTDIQNPAVFENINKMANELKDNLEATFGVNNIRKESFEIDDNIVTFKLNKYQNAKKVLLVGSFTGWQNQPIAMQKTETGWMAKVKLNEGKHLYKFIVDDNWMLDENNRLEENDGRGNNNSVFYKPNYVFTLKGFQNTKRVVLSGSFNNWNESVYKLHKTSDSTWELPVYLANGTYTYRFIVDDNWIIDPGNKNVFPNEFGDKNSVINIGETLSVILKGFVNAQKVFLTGSFNNYRDYELPMTKTSDGWQIDYALGDGNYEMKFIVDGKLYNADGKQLKHNEPGSILVNNPNYTFTLQGFENAKKVLVSGDFNNWNETSFAMTKDIDGIWKIKLHLLPGKHLYKLIVDNKWILDPGNKLWEENEYGTGNSVMWLDQD